MMRLNAGMTITLDRPNRVEAIPAESSPLLTESGDELETESGLVIETDVQ